MKASARAGVALVVAIVLRWVLDPILGDALPLVTLYGAVSAAVWLAGPRVAIAVALVGYLTCDVLFIEPRGLLFPRNWPGVVGLLAFSVTSACIIAIGAAMRRARARATEQGQLLRVTLGSIGDAVITTDMAGNVTFLNAVAESLTGWTNALAAGQPLDTVFRIVNEDTRKPVESPATRALREGTVVGLANHTVLLRRQGGECPIDDSAAPIRDEDGRVAGCVLVFRDVTAQRRAAREKANQLSTARLLAAIVESSDDAIISKSLDGIIQSWNAGAERVFGHTAAQAVGRHISLIIPPERLADEDRIIASLKAGQRVDHFETERIRRDGRRIQVSLTISPIRDDQGTVIGASKIARDVSRQREAEAERQRLEDDLRRAAADLSEVDRRKNEFLATLAHELRNPLAVVSNAARTLRRTDGAAQPPLDMLERQVQQMSRLVDDLMDLNRVTRGTIELRKERIELGPLVEQAVEAARAQYGNLNQQLSITLPPSPLLVEADPARLVQIIGNLLSNACKFTDAGGRIEVTAAREGAQVVLRVRDNGIGIRAAHLPRLFEMFSQAEPSLQRSREGLGIGLTLVRTLAGLHGGTVVARSEGLGKGSEFEVRLPLAETSDRAGRLPDPDGDAAASASSPGRRILIVDDNIDGAESLSMLLQLSGHETEVAHDGLEGVAAAERWRPDVVLLDIGLPSLNGYEVCRRIRAESWGKGMSLIALSGWGQAEDRQRSQEAGFDAHLVKPVNHDRLIKLLESPPRPGVPPARSA